MAMSRAHRVLFIFVALGILIALYHASPRLPKLGTDTFSPGWTPGSHPTESHSDSPIEANQTSPPIKALEPFKTDSRFISWLSARVPADRVPFITIGDCKYIHALRNFQDRLDQWGYGDDLVVICLDQCCADARGYHAYSRYIGESVAFVKFSINLDLTANGYNFVFFDGDAYLTGANNPFETMLPLSNDTWDIQFQTDHPDILDYNIGWYFAKATDRTFDFFSRSYARWNETQKWDQFVMWEIGHPMESEEHPLRVHHLNQTHYKNFMLYGLEYPFNGHETTEKFASESTIIHFTCIEQSLKTYFGYYFGGFGDMDGYYSDNPPLLGVANVSGMIDAVHAQVAFAAQLAHKTHRTFIWPDTVNLMQKRFDDKRNKTVILHQKRMPGIRAISWDSASKASLAAVEGNYLTNLKRVNDTELETIYMDARASIPALEEEILKLSQRQVAVLDFTYFSPPIHQEQWGARKREEEQGDKQEREEGEADPAAETGRWLVEREQEWFGELFEKGGYKTYSQVLLDKLKPCRRANWPSECLEACGGG